MTMMNTPLLMKTLVSRAAKFASDVEVVSRLKSHVHRYTYAEMETRSRQLANVMTRLGVTRGDRVASLAWNSYRHLELYYAVPCMGAVLHTLNLRLSAEQLAYVINHAEDKVICVDADLLPLLERLAPQLTTVKHFVVMSSTEHFETALTPAHDYEKLLAAEKPDYEWPMLDENTPMGLCYTSGTTGNPKGVMYTHRSNYLHTLSLAMPDGFALNRQSVLMAVVPMFHANAWGLPYVGSMLGIKQVFPGANMDGASICQLIEQERVTFTAGVPTIWMGMMNELKANPDKYDLSTLKTVVCGGSAPPRSLIDWFESTLNVEFIQAWGMTETSPLGSSSRLKLKMNDWPRDRVLDVKQRCGIIAPGLEARIVDDAGNEVPHDGTAMGQLHVRGPWVASSYYHADAADRFPDGWFDTGDIATIDAEGYVAIADRAKDLIKSGGEWISSVDLENAIMAMPGVAEAAVIGINHVKWQERPLACVVVRKDAAVTKQQVIEHLSAKFAKWWMPDDVVFLEALPKTSVGKFDKKVLRAQYQDYQLPS
jgi:fatty-acyl-CoA synthase